ncbi:LINE-1 retrotransposable element ORF2 protein [Cucumis melo var. makuwa]|uniref:LINE-1 retrotransposable element ORF2 protein n=1 Tax=Cucumis melo var. makuwa TaxID=1194695 RepID=A0A5D3BV09_CUCMM|nr:LINE-1 retrotransposable element ORF2 protein [Cucumis melo var. makuwa]TYK01929.1 LINE-1 retrotransposable element ORF2 protein [Cucumis melo var. makuwa]
MINSICDTNGNLVHTKEAITDVFQSYYQDIFSKKHKEEFLIDNLDWKPISSLHHSHLCKPFEEPEIKKTIISISNEKAPGPDVSQCFSTKCSGHTLRETYPESFRISIIKWKNKKTKGFVLKLDLEKAFDKISWRFIDFILEKKNFPDKWRRWIKACISNVHYSILINGNPKGRIKACRGIRQGDPLSPFIFVLAMDYLSRLLLHLEARGDNDSYIDNLQMALSLFERASGLKFNHSKSTISPVNIPADRTTYISNKLERSQKTDSWRYSQISKGGRLTLIKSSLTSLPTYQLSTFRAPVSVYKEIEKHWRDFLWKGNQERQSSNLINWKTCTSPKEWGGLGITKLKDTNKALLCKWMWRYHTEPNPLWKRCIDAKYSKDHQGDIPTVAPRLFSLSNLQNATVKEAWDQSIGDWNIYPRRPLNDREAQYWKNIKISMPPYEATEAKANLFGVLKTKTNMQLHQQKT